jgi:hypothetical protein
MRCSKFCCKLNFEEAIEMIRRNFITKITGSVFLTLVLVAAPIKLVSVAELEETRKELHEAQAYYTAAAGLQEAMTRLAMGELSDPHNPPNPEWQVEIYPKARHENRGDTLCVASIQDPNKFLSYCSSDYPLTIHYLLDRDDIDSDGETNEIVYYDPGNPETRSLTPRSQSLPIFVVTSTGIEGSVRKTLEMEVILDKGSGNLLEAN